MSGTLVAQLLNVLFIPIITRLYGPEELGELGYYLRIVLFFAALVTLRLELGFLNERHVDHRSLLLKFTLKWSLILSVLILIPLFVYYLFSSDDLPSIYMIVLIPAGVFLHALFNIGTHWELADERFSSISIARFTHSFITNGLKVGAGWLKLGSLGLIIAVIIGLATSSLIYLRKMPLKVIASTKKTGALLKKHRELYIYNLPHVLVDLFRDFALASLIIIFFSERDYGYFDHTFRVLKLPLTFLGAAVGQALFSRIAAMIAEKKQLKGFVIKTVLGLSLAATIPFAAVYFYGPELFGFVFGKEWETAGVLGSAMTAWLFMNMIVSPLSYLPVALDEQRPYFFWNVAGTMILILSILIPVYFMENTDFLEVIKLVTWIQVLYHLGLLAFFVKIIRKYENSLGDGIS
ncbi:MAG: lipopolysaccharide biosynthesis protein [Crocinitomicaceae bacterium]